jgi:predicted nucleotidyltransferase
MLARFKEGGLAESQNFTGGSDLFKRVFYKCIVGSRAYGLDDDGSDTDYRGVFLPSAEDHWSLWGVPPQIERHETQEHYWEVQRFLVLALKANPNVLECLYTPLVEDATPLAEEMLSIRSAFLSRIVYSTFNGYVMSQFKKMQADIRTRGEVKWKHVMHLIRLLISGIRVLREGTVPVRVETHRAELLAVRRGEVLWEDTERWRSDLHREFDAALQTTRLPEQPDYQRANEFLLKARRAALAEGLR